MGGGPGSKHLPPLSLPIQHPLQPHKPNQARLQRQDAQAGSLCVPRLDHQLQLYHLQAVDQIKYLYLKQVITEWPHRLQPHNANSSLKGTGRQQTALPSVGFTLWFLLLK